MKIKKIEFENFRQFKKKGIIRCSTDGKVTIIYGKNGEGKTTLHQLLFWIFYNSYNFNKTTTDKLYNLSYERESRNGEELLSWGKVDFEHNGVDYSIYREWTYKKELQRFKKVNERVQVLKLDENNDWKPFTSSEKEVKKIIEEILPSGLSEYFFFDGESMIADLRVKGKDSANKLKQALYIMFDLAYLDFGIQHIGDSDHSNTVIGSLFSRKVTAVNDLEAGKNKLEMLQAQKQMESVNEVIKEKEENKKNNANRIKFISEEIGAAKSNRQYESERRQQNKNIHVQEQYIQDEKIKFGDDIFDSYKVLLKKRFVLAQKLIKEKLKDSGKDLPLGLEKQLIISLIDEKTTHVYVEES